MFYYSIVDFKKCQNCDLFKLLSLTLCLALYPLCPSFCLCLCLSVSVSVSSRRQYALDKFFRLRRSGLGLGVLEFQKVGHWNLGNGLKLRGLLFLIHSHCSVFNFLLLTDIFPIARFVYDFIYIYILLFLLQVDAWFDILFLLYMSCASYKSSFQHQIILVTQIILLIFINVWIYIDLCIF